MREKGLKNALFLLKLTVVIPMAGCFTGFGPPSLDGSDVAFHASVADLNYEAIYLASEGCLDPVADTMNTDIPGGAGKFVSFGHPGEPSLDEGEVAFWGSGEGQEGIYLLSGNSFGVIADLNSSIPDGTGNFASFGSDPSLDSGRVAFRGSGSFSQEGIYHHDGNAIHVVADTNMPFPGGGIGAGNFVEFKDFMADGNNVVFIGVGPPPAVQMEGIYVREGDSLRVIADLNTPIPGGAGNFTSFGGSNNPEVVPSADGGSVAFVGEGPGQMGVYLETGGSISVVADLNTAIPSGIGNFTTFWASPSLSGGSVAFRGGGSGGQEGIYLDSGSSLDVVADKNTPIPGRTGNFARFLGFSVDGGNVAFLGGIGGSTDTSDGIYLYNGSTIALIADTNTLVPGQLANFYSFFLVSADGGNVAFVGFYPFGAGTFLYDGNTIHVVVDSTMPTPPCDSMHFYLFRALSAEGANIAFHGLSSGSACLDNRGRTPNNGPPPPLDLGAGIYLSMGGSLSVIADQSTPIPGGLGNFSTFLGVSTDGGKVAFRGSPGETVTDAGIYLHDGNTIQVVADRNTAIPGGVGNFETFSGYSADGDRVVFQGRGRLFPPQEGVYLYDGNAIRVVADTNTVVPGGTGKFESFSRVATNGGNVAFVGSGPGNHGVFLDTGGSLSTVADVHTPMPHGALFEHFDHVSMDGADVTFQGSRNFAPGAGTYTYQGIYLKANGNPISVVSDWMTPIPGRPFNLNHYGGNSTAAGSVAFYGGSWSDSSTFLPRFQGIYMHGGDTIHHDGDTIQVVADTLTPARFSRCSKARPSYLHRPSGGWNRSIPRRVFRSDGRR